jgi:AraC family ethanolamine operon transcriptional activator
MHNPQNLPAIATASGERCRVVTRIVGDCDQLSEVIRNGTAKFLQLGRGRFNGEMSRLDLNSLTFLHADCSNLTLVRGSGDREHSYAVIPMRWTGEFKWNGRVADRPGVYHWDSEVEYFRTGSDVETVALIFDRAELAPAFAEWTGGIASDLIGFSNESRAVAATPSFLHNIRTVLTLMADDPDIFRRPDLRKSVEVALRTAMFRAIWNGELLDRPHRALHVYRRIVRRVDDYLHAHEGQAVYLLDLCAITGVSARTLENAFRAICDMSPMRYLKQRRLRLARRLLRSGIAAQTSVKVAAIEAGFWDLGRFAADYRRHFGESPSETLRHR